MIPIMDEKAMGLTKLLPGDVIRVLGKLHIIDYINDCRARCLPLEREVREVTSRFGETARFTYEGKWEKVAPFVSSDVVLERRGEQGLREFLAAHKTARRLQKEQAVVNKQNGEGKDMGRRKKSKESEVKNKTKARGGLAAEAHKIAEGNGHSKGKLGKLMGFSVTSVLRRFGKEGVNTAHARLIVEHMGIKVAPATVQIQVGNGRAGKGEPAALTKDQMAELVGAVADPKKAA